jgi:alginate O-acetyltransferase complex protein AlgI
MQLAKVDTATAWVGSIAYTLQIYFDFCGYSLMAMGIGRIMGFSFPRNFNYPYISTSITEFWRRWHMSLSSWFKDYLYIPLGGNRKGPVRTYLNLFLVFFLCGLWHGAAWTFVAWGIFHGLVLIIERSGLSKLLEKIPAPFAHSYTLLLVIIGWVLFRAENFGQAQHFLSVMFSQTRAADSAQLAGLLTHQNITAIGLGIIFSAPLLPWALDKLYVNTIWLRLGNIMSIGTFALLFFASSVFIMAGTYNPFIYFRF